MQKMQQPVPVDSLNGTSTHINQYFWNPDSTGYYGVDSSCCILGNLYELDLILAEHEKVSTTDSSETINESKPIFRNSVIKDKPFEKPLDELTHLPVQNAYLSILFVIGFFLSGSISYANRKSFSMLLKSTASSLSLNEILRERLHITGVSFTAPFMLSAFLYAIFIAMGIHNGSYFDIIPGVDVIGISIILISVQVLKNVLIKGLGNIFDTSYEAEEHILFNHQFFCFSSWILVPSLGFMLFSPVNNVYFFHIITSLLISLSAIYTSFRLIVNFSYKSLSNIVLFILYICSTEVLPVLILFKTIFLIKDF